MVAIPRVSYVNGRYVDYPYASLHIEDRSVVFGDGVYEGINIVNAVLLDGKEHFDRLRYSLEVVDMKMPMSLAAMQVVITNMMRYNRAKNGFLYLQISRGTSPRNHLFPSPEVKPSLIMTLHRDKTPVEEKYQNGVKIITCPDLRWARRDAKTLSLLPNILAKENAAQQGAAESVLVKEGKVTEGTSSNHFIVDAQGKLRTHPTGHDILGGIVRMRVLDLVRSQNIVEVDETPYGVEDIYQARESFSTSTTIGVLPVVQADDRCIADGKVGQVTQRILASYREYIQQCAS